MPSFDIVSEIDNQEVHNAVDNANRELSTRFDFRNVEASFTWSAESTKMIAEGEFQLQQMLDILRKALLKRKVAIESMDIGKIDITGKTHNQSITFKQGIESDTAKKIVKLIKDAKLKVQAAIQGEQVRVTGKKRDDLQAVMALLREKNLDQAIQFSNFRD